MRRALLASILVLAACEPTNRPTMNPGQDCMTCHIEGGQANRLRWTVAGTVFHAPDSGVDDGVEGAHVFVMDKGNNLLRLTTNPAGNFYTAEPLETDGGLQIVLEYMGLCRVMHATPKPTYTYENPDGTLPNGPVHSVGCNHCHTDPAPYFGLPTVNPDWHFAPGRMTVPQYFSALLNPDGTPVLPGGSPTDAYVDASGSYDCHADCRAVLVGASPCTMLLSDGGLFDLGDAGLLTD